MYAFWTWLICICCSCKTCVGRACLFTWYTNKYIKVSKYGTLHLHNRNIFLFVATEHRFSSMANIKYSKCNNPTKHAVNTSQNMYFACPYFSLICGCKTIVGCWLCYIIDFQWGKNAIASFLMFKVCQKQYPYLLMHFNQIHRDTKEKKRQHVNGPPVALNMHFYNLNINACSIIELLLGSGRGCHSIRSTCTVKLQTFCSLLQYLASGLMTMGQRKSDKQPEGKTPCTALQQIKFSLLNYWNYFRERGKL